jgi:hypothetical protein
MPLLIILSNRPRSRPRKCIEHSRQEFPFLKHEYEYEKNQIRSHAFALRLFLFSAFRIPTSEFLKPYTFYRYVLPCPRCLTPDTRHLKPSYSFFVPSCLSGETFTEFRMSPHHCLLKVFLIASAMSRLNFSTVRLFANTNSLYV